MKRYVIHLCNHCKEPSKGDECREMISSAGESCKGCLVRCYRKGWIAKRVCEDNRKLTTGWATP